MSAAAIPPNVQAEWDRLRKRVLKTEEIATAEKEGFFTGRYAVNPFSGEKLPIWVANFVLAEYGTGALMCVPAHDQRDFEFCRKYKLPVRVVVQPLNVAPLVAETMTDPFVEHDQGTLVDSGPYSGLSPEQAIEKMTADAEAARLRQRPDHLPPERLGNFTPALLGHSHSRNLLPQMRHGSGSRRSTSRRPPRKSRSRRNRKIAAGHRAGFRQCKVPEMQRARSPRDGHHGHLRRFLLVFLSLYRSAQPKRAFDKEIARYWFPIDQYVGGITHAILHLLYSRFFTKVMRDIGLVKINEPIAAPFHTRNGSEGRGSHVQIARQRSRRHRNGRAIRLRHGPSLHSLRRSAGKRSGME